MRDRLSITRLHIQIWLRERKWAFMRWFVAQVNHLGERLQYWAQSQPYWINPIENRYAQVESRYRRVE